jgi:hypothetical protein
LHKFRKERRRSLRGCFECDNTTHFIADCHKRKKLDSSNRYDYIKRNDYSKGDDKKKHHFGDKRKKKKSFRRSCLECVLPSATLTSPVTTPPAQRRMRRSNTNKATSSAFASWASLRETSPAPTLM